MVGNDTRPRPGSGDAEGGERAAYTALDQSFETVMAGAAAGTGAGGVRDGVHRVGPFIDRRVHFVYGHGAADAGEQVGGPVLSVWPYRAEKLW